MKQRTLLVSALVMLGALATALWLAYATLWYLAIFSLISCGVSLIGLVLGLLAFLLKVSRLGSGANHLPAQHAHPPDGFASLRSARRR